MSELGLPSNPAAPRGRERTYTEYSFGRDQVSIEFFDKFTEADLVFGICEPTPAKMEQAGKLAGQNGILMAKELVFASLYRIGDWNPANSRDSSHETGIDAWWDVIGAKARDLITTEFTSMMAPSEEDATRFRDSKQVKRG